MIRKSIDVSEIYFLLGKVEDVSIWTVLVEKYELTEKESPESQIRGDYLQLLRNLYCACYLYSRPLKEKKKKHKEMLAKCMASSFGIY